MLKINIKKNLIFLIKIPPFFLNELDNIMIFLTLQIKDFVFLETFLLQILFFIKLILFFRNSFYVKKKK